jgi:hypothetical protein
MRAIFLLSLLWSLQLIAQPYQLNNKHEGEYELVGIFSEKYFPSDGEPEEYKRDTLVLEVSKQIKNYRNYLMVNFEVEDFYPNQVFPESPRAMFNYKTNSTGDLSANWLRIKDFSKFKAVDQRLWFTFMQCIMPLPSESLEKRRYWKRKQVKALGDGPEPLLIFPEYSLNGGGQLHEVLGYDCYAVEFQTDASKPFDGWTFAQKGTAHFEHKSGKLIKLELRGGFRLTSSFFNEEGAFDFTNLDVYEQRHFIQLQCKGKPKERIIPGMQERLERIAQKAAALGKQHDWIVPPIYHNVDTIIHSPYYKSRINTDHYLLDEHGQRMNERPYSDIMRNIHADTFFSVYQNGWWRQLDSEGYPIGKKRKDRVYYQNGLVGKYRAIEQGEEWQIVDTAGKVHLSLAADKVEARGGTYNDHFLLERNGMWGAVSIPELAIIPPVYSDVYYRARCWGDSLNVFLCTRGDSTYLIHADGKLRAAVPSPMAPINDCSYPYVSCYNTELGKKMVYNLDNGKFLGLTSKPVHSFIRFGEQQYCIFTDSPGQREHLVRLPQGDTLFQSSRIKVPPSYRGMSSQWLFFMSAHPKTNKRDQYFKLCSKNGETIIDLPFQKFHSLERYIMAGSRDEFRIFNLEGQPLFGERYFYKPIWITPHLFLSEGNFYNLRTQETFAFPEDWEYKGVVRTSNPDIYYYIVSDGQYQGIIRQDFTSLLAPLVDDIVYLDVNRMHAKVKIGGKVGILKLK